MAGVRVVIDERRCQGHGRCFLMAPALFDFDELGNGHVRGEGWLDASTRPLAELAEANCPEFAIRIEHP